jgi:hypothetical protein
LVLFGERSAFVDELDLGALGFDGVDPEATAGLRIIRR